MGIATLFAHQSLGDKENGKLRLSDNVVGTLRAASALFSALGRCTQRPYKKNKGKAGYMKI